MIEKAIEKLVRNEQLDYNTVEMVMDEIMTGKALDSQIASFLTALHMKRENIDEITASASVMRKHALKINHDLDVIDIVGTGGDCANTVNISTMASIVASAGGAIVAKHGNRAASSKCGTADVLEALGVNIMLEPEINQKIMKEIGICFLFAQKYHTAMKYVGRVRREIKIPTIFNILGPLANPAQANLQLLGVYNEGLVEPMANVLNNLGLKRGMVVYGQDGLDEISISAPTKVCELNNNEIKKYVIEPEKYGFKRYKKEDLVGGTPEENADYVRRILGGEEGAKMDSVIINAAAALHIYHQISIEEGIELAREIIESGKALKKLEEFIEMTNQKISA